MGQIYSYKHCNSYYKIMLRSKRRSFKDKKLNSQKCCFPYLQPWINNSKPKEIRAIHDVSEYSCLMQVHCKENKCFSFINPNNIA